MVAACGGTWIMHAEIGMITYPRSFYVNDTAQIQRGMTVIFLGMSYHLLHTPVIGCVVGVLTPFIDTNTAQTSCNKVRIA